MDVSSTEKTSTKEDLARVTTKSKSKTQTVTNGCVSQKARESSSLQASQHWRSQRVSKIKVQSPQGDIQEGQRLMIIELGKYNKIGELLIENRAIGFQGHLHYWDRGWRETVTMAAVHMGVKEVWMWTGHRVHTIGLQVGNENRYAHNHCGAIEEALACHNNSFCEFGNQWPC